MGHFHENISESCLTGILINRKNNILCHADTDRHTAGKQEQKFLGKSNFEQL